MPPGILLPDLGAGMWQNDSTHALGPTQDCEPYSDSRRDQPGTRFRTFIPRRHSGIVARYAGRPRAENSGHRGVPSEWVVHLEWRYGRPSPAPSPVDVLR